MLRYAAPFTLLALGAASPAFASGDEPVAGPAFDYGYGDLPHVVETAPPLPRGEDPQTIFINFDGPTLTNAMWDYAPDNETQFPDAVGEYPAFGDEPGSQVRQAVLDAVRVHYAPFAIDITDTRPEHIQHNMIVVSPRGKSPGKLGFASLNCGGSNPFGVGFAFFSNSDGASPGEIATTVSHEAAHTFGIEHSSDTADIMYPVSQPGQSAFLDQCAAVEGAEYCGENHAVYCETGGQNTYAELFGLFGMGEPDASGPEVLIVYPEDGERFDVGVEIPVDVEATDDLGVSQVRLFRDDELVGTDLSDPYEWGIDALPEGVYELHAVAIDSAGNEAMSNVVTFAVGDAELPMPDDEGDGGTGDAGLPGGMDSLDDEAGCGCRSSANGAPGSALLLLVAFAHRRRRRL